MTFTVVRLLALVASIRVVLAAAPLYGQCGGANWTGDTTCVSGATCVYSNDFYSQCIPIANAPTTSKTTTTSRTTTTTTKASTTTTKAPTTTAAPPAGVTTTLPPSAGYVALPTASVITGHFDGGMVKYDRKGSSGECQEQTETGEDDAVFILQPGASISNVIIGKDQAEGIHCRGTCTVTNVWWEEVCEDALTLEQPNASDVSTVNGGGAFGAEDKIIQHNGAGRVDIKNFFASSFGKLYRACGNCATSHERHVTVNNVCLHGGSAGVGINSNWGDTAILSGIKTDGKPSAANVCCTYQGVAKGSEPPKIGCGDGYSACDYDESAVGSC